MNRFIKNNSIFLLPILSGILLILAYPPYSLGFFVWISVIPLFLFLNSAISLKKAFWGGFLTGFLFFGKIFSWFFATYPFEWLGVIEDKSRILVSLLVGLIWLSQTIFLALFTGFFIWIIKKYLINIFQSLTAIIVIPAAWIILEYLRAWGFGIFWLGPESLLGPHWTFGNLAYALANNSALIQLANLGGIYLISFLIVLVNTSLFLILIKCKQLAVSKREIRVIILILVLIGTSWSLYGVYKLNSQPALPISSSKKVAILQTNFLSGSDFNPYSKQEVFNTVVSLISDYAQSSAHRPEIIIAPEGFGIISAVGSVNVAKHLIDDFWKSGQVYIENKKVVDENNSRRSRTFYYLSDQDQPLGYHDKLLLVPGGDYLPYTVSLLLNIYSFNLDYREKLYTRGEKIKPVSTPQGKIGGTVCSSIISPQIQRKMTNRGAQFLAVISSDAPFHGANSLLMQNLAMSKLRAVENQRYLLQATNMGHSFLLTPQGAIKAKSKELGNVIIVSELNLLGSKTIYTQFGDWIIILSTIGLLLTFLLWYNNKRKLS